MCDVGEWSFPVLNRNVRRIAIQCCCRHQISRQCWWWYCPSCCGDHGSGSDHPCFDEQRLTDALVTESSWSTMVWVWSPEWHGGWKYSLAVFPFSNTTERKWCGILWVRGAQQTKWLTSCMVYGWSTSVSSIINGWLEEGCQATMVLLLVHPLWCSDPSKW